MRLTQKLRGTLEKPEYFDIVLEILSGTDFASSIGRDLGKKQSTVTRQLDALERLGILRVRERRQSKKYKVVAGPLCAYVYSMVGEFIEHGVENQALGMFSKANLRSIDRKVIEKTLPANFLMHFFSSYAFSQLDVVGGKIQSLDEIVVSLFGALYMLSEKKIKQLLKEYEIDEEPFDAIVDVMAFESFEKAEVSILSMLDYKLEERSPQEDG